MNERPSDFYEFVRKSMLKTKVMQLRDRTMQLGYQASVAFECFIFLLGRHPFELSNGKV